MDPTGPIEYNTVVNISVDVTDQSLLVGGHVYADVVDMSNGICLYTEGFWLDRGTSHVVTFPITMQNNDMNLRISVSSLPLPFVYTCEDVKEFTIKQKYTMFNCVVSGTSKSCVGPVKNGTYVDAVACAADGCKPPIIDANTYSCTGKVCSPTGGTLAPGCPNTACAITSGCSGCDLTKSYCLPVLGCQSKNNVYIGIGALFLFMMMQKK
jgi:hypothetical protein